MIGEYPAYAYVSHIVGWAFLGLTISVLAADNRAAKWFRRLPGVRMMTVWLHERMFFGELFENLLLGILRMFSRITLAADRLIDALISLAAMLAMLPVRVIGALERPRLPDPPPPAVPADPGRPSET